MVVYEHEYMFNHFLMEHGFLVIDIDCRDRPVTDEIGATAIYRHMGGKDLDDHIDAAKFIVQQYGVDPKHIGLYGGSYGLHHVDGFVHGPRRLPPAHAAASDDWAHYNHGYTANI